MKALFILFFSSILFIGSAQTDCKPYIPSEEGSTWELTHYSKKDKVTGSTKYELIKKTITGDSVTFRIKAISMDEKGEEIYVNEFDAYCRGGIFEMNMSSKLNGETMSAYENMDVTVDATDFPIPTLDEPVGTILEDGTLNVEVGMNGMTTFRMLVEVTDRSVSGRETLETEAGTFDCVKISQSVKTKMIMKIEATSNEWYAEGVGIVRSESFDKKGRLSGYSVLTALDMK